MPPTNPPPEPKTVLITGCSAGGAGSALAFAFRDHGLTVFATARSLAKIDPRLMNFDNVICIRLDVENPASIAAAVETVKTHKGGNGKLDYLVNNAGMSWVRPALDTDVNQARKVFEVNYWGAVDVTHAFAPLIIETKGVIVNVSSLAGVLPAPWLAFYASSKAALKTYSEVLRLEMAPLGVRAVTVMSGVLRTNVFSNNPEPKIPDHSPWKPAEGEIRANATGAAQLQYAMTPEDFAQDVVRDVLGRSNGLVWRGGGAWAGWVISSFLPSWVLDRLFNAGMGLGKIG